MVSFKVWVAHTWHVLLGLGHIFLKFVGEGMHMRMKKCGACANRVVGELVGQSLGWPELYMYTVYGRMYGDFPAINTVYTTYIRMYVWFW